MNIDSIYQPIHNPYVPKVDKFVKSNEFRYLAEFYENEERYTNLPKGTMEYKKFWEDVKDKCLNGFTNSAGIRITGQHFFYLNFCRIEKQNNITKKKEEGFPGFNDLDFDYFHMIEYCALNEKSFICVKGRRQGYSYKAAAIATHEFVFYPKSKSIIGAFLSLYALGTMGMVLDNLNFLNNTEFRKQRNPDLKDHVLARYQVDLGGIKTWKGYHSEIRSITFKDRPEAAVGKSCRWLILDEAGIFPNITDTYGYTEPLIKDGSTYTGIALIFGSSGDMDSGSKYFYEMFINPNKYNLLEFVDPENEGKRIGYFSSALKGRQGVCKNPNSPWYNKPMIDENGNSNYEAAFDDIMHLREKARGGLDNKAIHGVTTQFPLTWKEAFLRNKGTVFASVEMLDWLGKLETNPELSGSRKKIELYFDDNGNIKPKLSPDAPEILSYPLGRDEDKRGCIVIYEDPEDNAPWGLYIAGCDPYDQDKADSSESLGSFIVYKRFYKAGSTHDIVVAEYSGRPEKADEFYENCRRLCIYYNAKCLYENQLKGLKAYFEMKNSLQYLFEQPQIIKDIVKDSKVARGYGIHMNRSNATGSSTSTGIKDQCEIYLKQWLYEDRMLDDKKVMNLHTIKSIPLLKELIAYDREINTDRVIALMLCILQSKEMHKLHQLEMNPKTLFESDPFFSRKYFNKNTYNKIKY